MSILKKLSNIFAPEVKESADNAALSFGEEAASDGTVTVNAILDALMRHFKETVRRLTTDYNLLYHTSFTIYLKARNYQEISDSLPFLASGAERMLVEEINRRAKDYPGYRPHSELWQFQLVEIPDDAEIEGVSADEMEQSVVIEIQSELFPPTEERTQASSSRMVSTVQGVNSLRAIRNCINPEILGRLHLIERDRIQLALTLDPLRRETKARKGFSQSIGTTNAGQDPYRQPDPATKRPAVNRQSISPGQKPVYFATLEAQDGSFLEQAGNKQIHTVAMTANELHISGRSAMPGATGVEVVRVDSDRIMTPHVKIRREASTGTFSISAIGSTTVNQRTMTCSPEHWVTLSKKSIIILNDEVQILFKAI